jgi:hypothetical protein
MDCVEFMECGKGDGKLGRWCPVCVEKLERENDTNSKKAQDFEQWLKEEQQANTRLRGVVKVLWQVFKGGCCAEFPWWIHGGACSHPDNMTRKCVIAECPMFRELQAIESAQPVAESSEQDGGG